MSNSYKYENLHTVVISAQSISVSNWLQPFGKITSRGRPKNVPEKRPDVHKTSPYGTICNAKGRILSGAPLGRTQNVNLTIIYKMDFYRFFSIFPDSHCVSDNALPK